MVYPISVKTKEDVIRINRVASEQEFDMSIVNGTNIVNAKSLLALFTLIGHKAYLSAPDGLDPNYFLHLIKKMKV